MAGKYENLVINPPVQHMTVKEDGRQIFHGFMANERLHGYPFTFGFQIITKPFKGDNPAHTHNFQEYIAWYGTNPDDPTDFDAEIEIYLGEEQEKYVVTQPTIVNLPAGLVHCPMEIKRVGKPIVQLELMLPPEDGTPMTREPFFEADRGVDPFDLVTIERTPQEEYKAQQQK